MGAITPRVDGMEMRVEELARRAGVSVDTVRYYQGKGLLDPPRRAGRIAWYGPDHLARLERIRTLQERGFTLAVIARLLDGELDEADEALLTEMVAHDGHGADALHRATPVPVQSDGGAEGAPVERTFTLAELAAETDVPLALLKAVEAEGLLIPRAVAGEDGYTDEDVESARAGLVLLEWGVPLGELLDVARRHREATEAVARDAVSLFSRHVRGQIREGNLPDAAVTGPSGQAEVDVLVQAYAELLPAVTTLVGHHFTRALLKAALEHVEAVGTAAERRMVRAQ
jgi:DNA-binding transcriptional MerR regulator